MAYHPDLPLIVQSDRTVLLEVDHPFFEEARDWRKILRKTRTGNNHGFQGRFDAFHHLNNPQSIKCVQVGIDFLLCNINYRYELGFFFPNIAY